MTNKVSSNLYQTGSAMANLPSYNNPPLEEVAFGCRFTPLKRWRIPHTGSLWSQFSKDYPIIEHAPPIFSDNTAMLFDETTGFPLPRVWFINNTESRLIQFQQDRFHYNWRKREGEPAYPRFNELFSKFSEYIDIFEKFTADHGLGLVEAQSFELSYINHIHNFLPDKQSTLFDVLQCFLNNFKWDGNNHYLSKPKDIVLNTTFSLPNEFGDLIVKIGQGKRTIDGPELLVFELTARGINPSKLLSNRKEWFDVAHECIVNSFTDLTCPNVQYEQWGRNK
jgi:uncharacterized protein (TIGR04255 family)